MDISLLHRRGIEQLWFLFVGNIIYKGHWG